MSDHLTAIWRGLALICAAVQENEAAYTETNFSTITSNLDSARDAVLAAVNANASGSNPN